jgi:hypothetical protein
LPLAVTSQAFALRESFGALPERSGKVPAAMGPGAAFFRATGERIATLALATPLPRHLSTRLQSATEHNKSRFAGGPYAGRIVGVTMAAASPSGSRQSYGKQTVNDDWKDD